ncbi:FecR family protein [Halobacteriovorax sp. GB3]|uniref:FecR family protein n=1 Tax=Halobacteriovorax sp. GB3 TaxID=2719615 RepID=UPI00235F09A8|nr:FecR family protein [Halobacteriovorax sp. GB3]MDD0853589.1 FecR family protein [Halobacteriovorax sp. GB3]
MKLTTVCMILLLPLSVMALEESNDSTGPQQNDSSAKLSETSSREPAAESNQNSKQTPQDEINKENEDSKKQPDKAKEKRDPKLDAPMAIASIVRGEVFIVHKKKDESNQDTEELKEIKKDDPLNEGDLVRTGSASFLRLKMKDETILNIGPESEITVEKFEIEPKRTVLINHLRGQVRANIQRKSKDGEQWKLNTRLVSVGVRGTVFLSNAYQVKGKAVTDVALVKGKVVSNVAKLGGELKTVNLEPGQYFNSTELAAKGQAAIKQLSPEALKALAEKTENMVPKIQDADGNLLNLDKLLRSSFGLPPIAMLPVPVPVPIPIPTPTLGGGGGDEKKEPIEKPAMTTKEEMDKNSRLVIKGAKHKELKDQPWDIRDAIQRHDQLRAEKEECFFWFYKTIPGGGALERFRRERGCDEFDNY